VLRIQDPRSGIRDPEKTFRIPDPGDRKAADPGSATIYKKHLQIIIKMEMHMILA
jgi:hypothetical protein